MQLKKLKWTVIQLQRIKVIEGFDSKIYVNLPVLLVRLAKWRMIVAQNCHPSADDARCWLKSWWSASHCQHTNTLINKNKKYDHTDQRPSYTEITFRQKPAKILVSLRTSHINKNVIQTLNEECWQIQHVFNWDLTKTYPREQNTCRTSSLKGSLCSLVNTLALVVISSSHKLVLLISVQQP